MKILLTHRYFWPDTPPYAYMLRSIGEGLVDAGHKVHVFASRPSYRDTALDVPKREILGRLHVYRCWVFRENRRNVVLRVVNVFLYCVALFFHVLRLRPDVVTASTFPPVVAGWTASLAARLVGARFVYHIMDIHPEVSLYSGDWMGLGMLAYVLKWMDNQTLRRAAATIVLSEDMAVTLASRGLENLPVHIINNFSLDDFAESSAPPAELTRDPASRRVIFAGNLGRFQNLLRLAEGVAQCFEDYPDLELFFLGDGAALADLKVRWENHPQVRFRPFLPFAQAKPMIEDSAVGLVSLAPNIYRVAYPSKVLTYAELGIPILALVEPESHLAQELEVAGIGVVAQDSSPQGIALALRRLLDRPPERDSVLAWYANTSDQAHVINLWRDMIEGLDSE